MTWLIAIDESGNLGKDTRFFTMSAIVIKRARNLNPVYKEIPTYRDESKFYNSSPSEITNVLTALGQSGANVFSVTFDKYDYDSIYYGIAGKNLYKDVLADLLALCFSNIRGHDATVYVDRNPFISISELTEICSEVSGRYDVNVRKAVKATSHQNRCIQVADYAAGAISRSYERGDSTYSSLIENISVARKH